MNDLYTPQLDLPATKVSVIKTQRIALGALLILLVGAAVRVVFNVNDARALQEYTAKTLERNVLVTSAKPGELQRTLALPTTLRGNTEAVIYARTAGYLTAWYKGIGDQVKKGELLATIDAPEQTQELAQARAQREQFAARSDLAEQTLARWEQLQQRQSAISQQDLAEKRSSVRQAKADLDAANANVKRLEQLESFRRIVAPFNGILTRRSIEVGDLIANGGKELFAITQTDPLRLTIWVSQAYADDLKVGAPVAVNLREQASTKLNATIERIAGGIDPDTRARQVDLILPNPDAKILPGVYAEVDIKLSSGIKALVVPAAVLIITDQTPRVAVVEKDNRITYRNVKLGRDLGRDVEILDGLSADDVLVVSPSDQLVEGELVATKNWQPTIAIAANAPKKENGEGKKEQNKVKEK
ncbi:MAG: efflux RND transporter periplasmic adaptor subunit [Gammaproteobacteria bacterium]|nr:MAG: efflux RND transporter periplasmic adaptor subunit [Gammaproteobacteria bacterium]